MSSPTSIFDVDKESFKLYGWKPASNKTFNVEALDWAYAGNVIHVEFSDIKTRKLHERKEEIVTESIDNLRLLCGAMAAMAEWNHHIPRPFRDLHDKWVRKLFNLNAGADI